MVVVNQRLGNLDSRADLDEEVDTPEASAYNEWVATNAAYCSILRRLLKGNNANTAPLLFHRVMKQWTMIPLRVMQYSWQMF